MRNGNRLLKTLLPLVIFSASSIADAQEHVSKFLMLPAQKQTTRSTIQPQHTTYTIETQQHTNTSVQQQPQLPSSPLDTIISVNARNVSMEYLFSLISEEANIPIVLKDFVSDGPIVAGMQQSTQSAGTSTQSSIPNSYVPGTPSNYPFGSTMLGYVSYYTGPKPLKYVLDEICGLYDLSWKYNPKQNVIYVYRYETKMFMLKLPMIQKNFNVDLDTSSANSANGGMAGLPGQTGSTSSQSIPPGNVNPATGNYKLQYQYNQKILLSIQTMLYTVLKDPGDKLSVTPMGYVMVTARPHEIQEIKTIINNINKVMSDVIPLRITVLAVQMNREYKAGLNLFNFNIPGQSAVNGGISLGNIQNGFSIGISNLSWNTVFQALEQVGKIHVLENDQLEALNYQPIVYAPITNQTILEGEVSNVITSTTGNTVTETPIINTIVTGSNLLIVPYKLSKNKIVVDMFRNQQQLLALQQYTFNAGSASNSFMLPSVQSNSNIQQTVLRKGQKLILLSSIVKGSDLSSNGIPGLSDIPVLGWLFSQKDLKHTNYQFLIIISYE